MKTLQARMSNLYIHQMERGGIIDSNADDTNVISIQSEDAREEVLIQYSIFLKIIFNELKAFISNIYIFFFFVTATKKIEKSSIQATTNRATIESSAPGGRFGITKCNNGEKRGRR